MEHWIDHVWGTKRRNCIALTVGVVFSLGLVGLAGQSPPPAAPTGLRFVTGGTGSTSTSTLGRLYDAASPWNTPIPANPSIDPNSAAMAQAVASAAQSGGFEIVVKEWSWPIYLADSTTPRFSVGMTASWAPAKSMSGVPIPSIALPDPAGDGHMVVIDTQSHCEYDFWEAIKPATGGNWTASWGNVTTIDGMGWYPGGYSATGSGHAGGAGVIRPEELAAGVIPHAIGFAFPLTKAGGPVLPATESDGKSTASNAIPEGAHLQLDPSLDLSTLGLNSYEMIIGRALQQYGLFLTTSTGHGVSFPAQNPQSTNVAYPWGDQIYVQLPLSLVSRLRVLTLGPQYKPTGYLNPGGCATFN